VAVNAANAYAYTGYGNISEQAAWTVQSSNCVTMTRSVILYGKPLLINIRTEAYEKVLPQVICIKIVQPDNGNI